MILRRPAAAIAEHNGFKVLLESVNVVAGNSVAPSIVDSAKSGSVDVTWSMPDADFETLLDDRRLCTALAAGLIYRWDSTDSLVPWGDRLSQAKPEVEAELDDLADSPNDMRTGLQNTGIPVTPRGGRFES